jgi:hypothetical protein
MADFALAYGTEEILKRVSSLVAQGINLASGVKGDMKRLEESLAMIQAVLQDAEKRVQVKQRGSGWRTFET